MKPTSPLSLLLFLRLAAATPIPILDTSLSACHSRSCVIATWRIPHPPPTRFTEPHFPPHQLQTFVSSSEDATPILSAERFLSSNFLQSLSNPASASSTQEGPRPVEALPSKPSSALPDLRAADLRKYWESMRPSQGEETHHCGDEMSTEKIYWMRRMRVTTRRDYADLMVVGIVVLFLVVVVALEAVERISDLNAMFCGRKRRRGQIYLEDDEENLFVVRKPFELSPAPMGRERDACDEKMDFVYDSDSAERC